MLLSTPNIAVLCQIRLVATMSTAFYVPRSDVAAETLSRKSDSSASLYSIEHVVLWAFPVIFGFTLRTLLLSLFYYKRDGTLTASAHDPREHGEHWCAGDSKTGCDKGQCREKDRRDRAREGFCARPRE